MYKAKYFPESSFWEAESHPSPSFSWRSISEAKSVLVKGARCQVGDGNHILIDDPWLPRAAPFRLLPVQGGRDEGWKVSNLMNNEGSWNETLVWQVCHVDDIRFILSIPLSNQRIKDRWMWHFDSKGMFSVKSAYRLLIEEEMVQETPLHTQDLWKKLWSTKVSGLHRRPTLPGLKQLQFMEWFGCCASNLPPNLWAAFVYNLWGIWKERNNRLWDNKNMEVNQVVLLLSTRLQEYQRHQGKDQGGGSRRVVPWKPPSAGWVKINVDGAFYKDTCTGALESLFVMIGGDV
ncbi:uncharacterized protein LOC112163893 [Rosa chinensis]|uniref:uncharacterized protein LOC112163893 n=1 Tax=Rosa chinensis TaxID=74649 RepID=UPI000D0945D1|nr:uncharacterized protein LOC112163893 [Rosa chinensis]